MTWEIPCSLFLSNYSELISRRCKRVFCRQESIGPDDVLDYFIFIYILLGLSLPSYESFAISVALYLVSPIRDEKYHHS